jgi:hypothetical protein
MHGHAVSGWLLVALCGAGGAHGLARLRHRSPAARRAAADDALMGIGMAAMAFPAAAAPPWVWAGAAVLYTVAALPSLPALRGPGAGAAAHHLVGSLAMVHMSVAMAGPGGHGGPGAARLLTGALLLYCTVYVLVCGGRLAAPAETAGGGADEVMARARRLAASLAVLAMLPAL